MKYSEEGYQQYLEEKLERLRRLAFAHWRRHGVNAKAAPKVLDFGCQSPSNIESARSLGWEIFGFDIGDPATSSDVLRLSTLEDYKIPFEDGYFDIVYSHHVFEHVKDWGSAIAELRRVTSPGGVHIHAFPSRLRLFEAHFRTPLGGVFNSKAWCFFWAWRRKKNRQGQGWLAYAKNSSRVIREELSYPNSKFIAEQFSKEFHFAWFEVPFIKTVMQLRLPAFMALFVRHFHLRVLALSVPHDCSR